MLNVFRILTAWLSNGVYGLKNQQDGCDNNKNMNPTVKLGESGEDSSTECAEQSKREEQDDDRPHSVHPPI